MVNLKKFLSTFLLFLVLLGSHCKFLETGEIIPLDWTYKKESPSTKELFPPNEYISLNGETITRILVGENSVFQLAAKFSVSNFDPNNVYSLDFGTMYWADEIYLNGMLIGKTGDFSEKIWNHWLRTRIYSFSGKLLKEGENLIQVRLFVGYRGGINPVARFGTFKEISKFAYFRELIHNRYFEYFCFLFGLLAIYHIALYLDSKNDKNYLYYAFFCLSYSILSFTYSPFSYQVFPFEYLALQKLMLSSVFLCLIFLKLFLFHFFEKPVDKSTWFVFFLLDILPIIIILIMPTYSSLRISQTFLLPLTFPGIFMLIYISYWAIVQKKREAIWMMKGLLLLCSLVLLDIFTALSDGLEKMYFSGFGISIFTVSFLFFMASRDTKTRKLVESLNASLQKINENLEERVIERTQEATTQLEEIQNLKRKQDADYFLTSLITEPLCHNSNISQNIKTDIFVSQRKKFQHGNLKGEVGGDICITGNIELNNQKDSYLVFFNADAMGKSLQGAGGSIVAGTAVNSIITRSKLKADEMLLTPEEWLEIAHQELNHLFETFNGLMSISCIFGLISESTKEMLYFNADHPFPVLLRKGEAKYLRDPVYTKKLGSLLDTELKIFKVQLQKDDILLIGSDGKDDLRSFEDDSILDDSDHFLELVKKTNGDLGKIYESIQRKAIITDDISLIRIFIES